MSGEGSTVKGIYWEQSRNGWCCEIVQADKTKRKIRQSAKTLGKEKAYEELLKLRDHALKAQVEEQRRNEAYAREQRQKEEAAEKERRKAVAAAEALRVLEENKGPHQRMADMVVEKMRIYKPRTPPYYFWMDCAAGYRSASWMNAEACEKQLQSQVEYASTKWGGENGAAYLA